MMARSKQLAILFFFIQSIYAQETILAHREPLAELAIDTKEIGLRYSFSDEGFFSPNGPFIDASAQLFFFPTYERDHLISFSRGVFSRIDLTKNKNDYEKLISAQYVFASLQGTISVPGNGLTFNYYNNEFRNTVFDWTDQKVRATDYTLTPIPNGMLLQSTSKNLVLTATFLDAGKIKVRDLEETRAWLPTQPGGFTIGDDGLLYRNGVVWSAISPKVFENYGLIYIARLMSGHTIWAAGTDAPGVFFLVNSQGTLELTLNFPMPSRFNYGVGPWGEIYVLIAPPIDMKTYEPDPTKPAELVVVRNHLKYFGRLNDSGVRLRKDPTTTGEILGTFPAKTGFRILAKGIKEETIGGQKNVWYRVRLLDGKEGWFFGAFVHNLYDGPNGQPPPWPNVPDW